MSLETKLNSMEYSGSVLKDLTTEDKILLGATNFQDYVIKPELAPEEIADLINQVLDELHGDLREEIEPILPEILDMCYDVAEGILGLIQEKMV